MRDNLTQRPQRRSILASSTELLGCQRAPVKLSRHEGVLWEVGRLSSHVAARATARRINCIADSRHLCRAGSSSFFFCFVRRSSPMSRGDMEYADDWRGEAPPDCRLPRESAASPQSRRIPRFDRVEERWLAGTNTELRVISDCYQIDLIPCPSPPQPDGVQRIHTVWRGCSEGFAPIANRKLRYALSLVRRSITRYDDQCERTCRNSGQDRHCFSFVLGRSGRCWLRFGAICVRAH